MFALVRLKVDRSYLYDLDHVRQFLTFVGQDARSVRTLGGERLEYELDNHTELASTAWISIGQQHTVPVAFIAYL